MIKKHKLIMLACCLIALGASVAILVFDVPANKLFIILMFLLCPLSHFLMMGNGKHDNHEHMSTEKSEVISPKHLGER